MATDPEPVVRPTQVQPPEQWTRADVNAARDAGRHDLIVQADKAGQLRELRASDAAARVAVNTKSVIQGDEA